MDQQTKTNPFRGGKNTLNSLARCLKTIDNFRALDAVIQDDFKDKNEDTPENNIFLMKEEEALKILKKVSIDEFPLCGNCPFCKLYSNVDPEGRYHFYKIKEDTYEIFLEIDRSIKILKKNTLKLEKEELLKDILQKTEQHRKKLTSLLEYKKEYEEDDSKFFARVEKYLDLVETIKASVTRRWEGEPLDLHPFSWLGSLKASAAVLITGLGFGAISWLLNSLPALSLGSLLAQPGMLFIAGGTLGALVFGFMALDASGRLDGLWEWLAKTGRNRGSPKKNKLIKVFRDAEDAPANAEYLTYTSASTIHVKKSFMKLRPRFVQWFYLAHEKIHVYLNEIGVKGKRKQELVAYGLPASPFVLMQIAGLALAVNAVFGLGGAAVVGLTALAIVSVLRPTKKIEDITARLQNADSTHSSAAIKTDQADSKPASRLEYNKPIRRHEPMLDGLPMVRRGWITVLGALVGVIMGVGGAFGMAVPALPSEAEINSDPAIIDLKYEYGARYDFDMKNFNPDRIRVEALDKKAVKFWRYWSSRLLGLPIECLIEKEKEEKDELEIYVPEHVLAAALRLSGEDETGRGYVKGHISRWANSLARLHLGHTMRYQAVREDMLIRRGLRWFWLWNRTNRLLWHGGDHAHDRLEAGPMVADYLKGEEITVNPAEILRVVLHMAKIAKEWNITLGKQAPDIDKLLEAMKTKDYYSEKAGINKLLDVLEEKSDLFNELLNEKAFKDKASRDMIAAGVADVVMTYNEVDVDVNAQVSKISRVKRLETLATEKYIKQLLGILQAISDNRPEGLEEKNEAFFDRVGKMQACLEAMANAAETGKLIQITDENAQYLAGEINYLESETTRISECGPDFKQEVLFVSSPVAEMHKVKIGNKIHEFPTRTIAEAMLPKVEGEKSGLLEKTKTLINRGVYPVKKFRGRKERLDENTWKDVDNKLGRLGSKFGDQKIDVSTPLAQDLFSNERGKLQEQYGCLLAARSRKAQARAQGEFVRGIIRYMYRYAEENCKDPKIEEHLTFINELFAGMDEIDNTREVLATYQGKTFYIPLVLLARGYRGALGYLLDLLRARDKDGKVRGEVKDDVLRKYFRRLFKLRMGGAA